MTEQTILSIQSTCTDLLNVLNQVNHDRICMVLKKQSAEHEGNIRSARRYGEQADYMDVECSNIENALRPLADLIGSELHYRFLSGSEVLEQYELPDTKDYIVPGEYYIEEMLCVPEEYMF